MRRRGRRRQRPGEEGSDSTEEMSEEPKSEAKPASGATKEGAPIGNTAGPVERKDDSEDKKSSEILKKEGLLAQLFEWESDGYETAEIEKAVQANDPEIEAKFKAFSDNVAKLRELVKKMEEIEVDERLMEDIQKIRDLMNNPSKIKEIESALRALEVKASMQKYRDDLESLNTQGLEKEVEAINKLMEDPANKAEIERLLKDLKRKVKERFFESEIAMAFKPAPKKKVKKIKIVKTKLGMKAAPFKIHDIFLFHHNGELISHHTRRTDIAANKAQLANMLKVIQNNIKSPKRTEIKRIEFGNYKILFQDGQNITASAAITGGERNEMFLLMKKVIAMLEMKFPGQLTNWSGETSSIPGIDKYMAALIQVFIKMELKANAPKQAQ